jgi:hypothetical protein
MSTKAVAKSTQPARRLSVGDRLQDQIGTTIEVLRVYDEHYLSSVIPYVEIVYHLANRPTNNLTEKYVISEYRFNYQPARNKILLNTLRLS